MTNPLDYSSPDIQYAFDLNTSPLFIRNENNFANIASQKQLNSLTHTSLIDIYLSTDHVVEPHYHQTASEIVYCIKGAVTISLFNPFTKKFITYAITPGQIVNIPQGWWHFEIATEDHTHILAIFDSPNPDTVLGSEILALTPSSVIAHTYGLNKELWEKTISNLIPGTFIGPPSHT